MSFWSVFDGLFIQNSIIFQSWSPHALTPKRSFAEQKLIPNRNISNKTNNGKNEIVSKDWEKSYDFLSHKTFDRNKNGSCLALNTLFIKKNTKNAYYFINQIQSCGFKTNNRLHNEEKKKLNLFSFFKKIFKTDGKYGSSNDLLKMHNKLSSDDNMFFKTLQDGSLTKEEAERLKVAFAEGYISGSGTNIQKKPPKLLRILQQVFVVSLVIVIFISVLASFGSSVFKIPINSQVDIDSEVVHITFDDVKGVDEAKQELQDVVQFLKNPERFSSLGAKLPKGVLLVGSPGTGKTLLARAVAGEANVPFFHAAGPEFDEILVGQGAKRVRELFRAAKDKAPCVIFIDEIDSIGAKRTNSMFHPYANQTINQLLSEMDGFHSNQGVIVLGATNRKNDLDSALLRPGRFDIVVNVTKPDFVGRKQILTLYIDKIQSRDVDIDLLARGTLGFTGADLQNMINQAALQAAMNNALYVTTQDIEEARDKILMGPERKSRIPDEETNLITAYHEAGHAVVAYYTSDSDPLHKVTIMPRGPSLGHTAYIPGKEQYHVTKSKLLAKLDTLMGGRAAEELIFGADKITSGASNDLEGATFIATKMVKDWGMSEKIGLRTLKPGNTDYITVNDVGQVTIDNVDAEIKQILQESYERAKKILTQHAREHKLLAEALIKYETLDADDVKAIMFKKRPIN